MAVSVTALGEVIVAGDDYVITFTLTKDGATYDITGATVTCTLRPVNGSHNSIVDHAVVITTAASGICTLTLLDTETATLLSSDDAPNYRQAHEYLGDVKVVESGGDIVHCGPFSFEVRRKIT